jgi:hypothetical protein
MARTKSSLFKINGVTMFAPDMDVDMSFEDIDSADTGRDEAGVMHRVVVRYKVGTWSFVYSSVTEEEYNYMESLFPDDGTFTFTHPDRKDSSKSVTSECYRSKYSITWKNARTGKWRNYKFNIIET